MRPSISQRFFAKLRLRQLPGVKGQCWEYAGATTQGGYGQFHVGSKAKGTRRAVRAHRMAWVLTNGPVPDGFDVLHKCDNPPCCNPAHLKLGDHTANMQDVRDRGRRKGSRNANARVNEGMVEQLRALAATGNWTHRQLAQRFGLSATQVSNIINGVNWSN